MPYSPVELQTCTPKNFEGSLSFRFEIKETAEVDRLGDWHDRIRTTYLCQRILHSTTHNLHYTSRHHFLVDNQDMFQLYEPRRQLQQLDQKIIH